MTATEDEKKKALEIFNKGAAGHSNISRIQDYIFSFDDAAFIRKALTPAKVDGDEVGMAISYLQTKLGDMMHDEAIAVATLIQAATSQQGREWTEDELLEIALSNLPKDVVLYKQGALAAIRNFAAKGIIRVKLDKTSKP